MQFPLGLFWYDAVQIACLIFLFVTVTWLSLRSVSQGESIASIRASLKHLEQNHLHTIDSRLDRIEKELDITN